MRARLPRCRLTRDNGGHGAPDTCADRRNALRAAPGAMGDPAGNSLNPKTSETAPRGDDHRDPPKPSTSATVRPIEATPRSRSRPAPHRGRWQSRSRPARTEGDGSREARRLAPAHAGRRGVETVGGGVGLATHGGAETLSSQYVGRTGGEDLAERNNPRNNRGLRVFSGRWGGQRRGRLTLDNCCYRASNR